MLNKSCFKVDSKQKIIISKKIDYVQFKNYEKKLKSQFISYANFESILVPEDNGKRNPEGSYTKYIKNILVEAMAINCYVFMMSLVSLLRNTQAKM